MAATPTVLALDFDGVLCDGLREYFKTSWQAYCNLWLPTHPKPPDGLAESFYRLRSVVETGWEMPLVLHAVLQGVSEEAVLQDWAAIAQEMVATEHLDPATLIWEVDGTRDQWIATDVDSWLGEHRFYRGVCDRLKATLQTDTQVAIISTKEGRFIQQLLEQQGIDLTDLHLFGKEVKRPKSEVLFELMQVFGNDATFWFVEDRLKTLQGIAKKPELNAVQLFLADWGYNTNRDRKQTANDSRINLISLDQFAGDFAGWL